MKPDMTYEKAIKNADALKARGEADIYLFGKRDMPWHIADSCESGCTIRMGTSVSARFSGVDKNTGLRFSWFFDLEDRNANGSGSFHVDVDACKAVMRKLTGNARVQFREYLSDCATHVKKCGDEYAAIADKQFRYAAVLRDLVNS